MASLRDYAASRLGALRAAQEKDPDATKSGPFRASSVPATPPDSELTLAELYRKYKKPGSDTVPHTGRLSPAERRELADEIDVGKRDYSR